MRVLAAALLLPVVHCRFQVLRDSYSTGADVAETMVLSNTVTGEHASILLNAGGGVDALWLAPRHGMNQSLREVLWSYNRNATAVLSNPTWQGRMLLPYANRIGDAVYAFNGSTHRLPVNDVSGLNNSLHGLLWNRTMHVVGSHADRERASVTLSYHFNSEDPTSAGHGYPFALGVSIEYILSQGRFDVEVSARNEDSNGWPLPFFNGWHPYFLCHPCSEAYVVLDKSVPWRHVDVATGPEFPPPRHSNMVPTTHLSDWCDTNGSAPLGPASDLPNAPRYMDVEVKAMRPRRGFATRLVDTSTGQTVVLHHDAAMQYLQIFTGAAASFDGAPDAVVLEPLSAMADAYNNHDGLHVVSSGETFISKFGVKVEAKG